MLAANDEGIYNSNHIIWIDFWLGNTSKTFQELVELSETMTDQDEFYIEKCIGIAIFMVKKFTLEHNQHDASTLILPFLKYVKQFVSGSLFTLISQIQFKWDVFEPSQAPKGWKCALCLERNHSHMTIKTNCGHQFHLNCFIHLTNPACPLCRQIMNV
jgi:hypothetical protein